MKGEEAMSNEMIGLIAFAVFIGGIAFIVWLDFTLLAWRDKRRDKKRRQEHPEFFLLYDDYDEKGTTACRFYNSEIAPLKRQVKAMLEEEPYWPQEVREQKMEELEEIRRKIYVCECASDELFRETEEARKKVADYVHSHNIKWAGDWD